MRIYVNFQASLSECPECNFEQDIAGQNAECRSCGYHCGSELAEQWLEYCERLTAPTGAEITFCHEAEVSDDDYWIEIEISNDANFAVVEEWLRALGGFLSLTVEDGSGVATVRDFKNAWQVAHPAVAVSARLASASQVFVGDRMTGTGLYLDIC